MSVGDNLPATGRPLAGPARTTWPILMAIVISLIILLGLMVMIFVWCINAIANLF